MGPLSLFLRIPSSGTNQRMALKSSPAGRVRSAADAVPEGWSDVKNETFHRFVVDRFVGDPLGRNSVEQIRRVFKEIDSHSGTIEFQNGQAVD